MRAPWLATLLLLAASASAWNIMQFGAIPGESSDAAASVNSVALLKAFMAANASSSDRSVLIPATQNFTIFKVALVNVYSVQLVIDGTLFVSNNITSPAWPPEKNYGIIDIQDSADIEITGTGLFDGQGYDWWWYVFLTSKDARPHMIKMVRTVDILIHNIKMINSPQYHILLNDVRDVVVRDMTIHVDVDKQKEVLTHFGALENGLPIFPLNTDGIDPAGMNVLIDNVTIQNFDDAVAVKPMSSNGKYSSCSRNMTIRNSRVSYGVGMTIGSVPPNSGVNCVEDILFQNINFTNAIKAVYIKSNPGTDGTGIINNITYKDINVDGSLWYPIWIGPQQQQQPGTNGTGCSFFYPIVPQCPTQPRVNISNINLIDMTFTGGLTLPGVVLCDPDTPCTGFNFQNIQNSGPFLVSKEYVCKNVQGTSSGVSPGLCF